MSGLNQVRVAVMGSVRDAGLDSAAQAVATNHSFVLEVEYFDPKRADAGALMDLLELLPKAGFAAVDLRDPEAQVLTPLTTWTTSAKEAGVVDSICLTESDARLPDGYNVAFLATRRILAEMDLDVRGRSVVLLADSVSDQGAVAALVGSGADEVRTAPRRPDIQQTQTDSTAETPWMIDITRTGGERGNIDVNPEDPATGDTIRWLFWAERLRQLIHVARGPALPFSFSQELAEAQQRLTGSA